MRERQTEKLKIFLARMIKKTSCGKERNMVHERRVRARFMKSLNSRVA